VIGPFFRSEMWLFSALCFSAAAAVSHRSAVLVVDIQNDFTAPPQNGRPGGALYVARGETVVPNINRLLTHSPFSVATQDWHPAGHVSFASAHGRVAKRPPEVIPVDYGLMQALWPDHCLQHQWGSALYDPLHDFCIDVVVRKGSNKTLDSYSGFFENGHLGQTPLHDVLQGRWNRTSDPTDLVVSLRSGRPLPGPITRLFVCGLALDFCVKYSALDAAGLGYDTYLVTDAAFPVNDAPAAVIAELKAKGVKPITTAEAMQLMDAERKAAPAHSDTHHHNPCDAPLRRGS